MRVPEMIAIELLSFFLSRPLTRVESIAGWTWSSSDSSLLL